MSKVTQAALAVRTFVEDVKSELKKSSWPTRSELVESTTVIIISVILLGAFVGAGDWFLGRVIELLVQ